MRRLGWFASALCVAALTAFAQSPRSATPRHISAQQLQQEFLDFKLAAAAGDADPRLQQQPGDVTALFIRMETAALQQRTDAVLDSALRLCSMAAPPDIQEIASSRILENAANSQAFDEVLRRVGLAMEENNACTFNLRLAIVAAAADGNSHLDLDKTAASAGLLTHWRIAGPFGRLSNIDFERSWPAESSQFWSGANPAVERFWFRDGMASLPDYLSSPGVFYAATDVQSGPEPATQLDFLSAGPYMIFIDGKQVLSKDSRYAAGGNRESLAMRMRPGRHRIVVKFTADAAPFSVDLHPAFAGKARPRTVTMEPGIAEYIRALLQYFRGDFSGVERILALKRGERGPFLYLRALLWSAVEDRSPRAQAAWDALSQADGSALLAQIRRLEFALDGEPTREQRAQVAELEQRRPESEAVAQLGLKLARRDGSAIAQAQAFRHLLELHPTCARLAEAVNFYTVSGEQMSAQRTEDQLSRCAPDSLDYARILSDSGRQEEAATVLQQKITRNGLNRAARWMLVKQLVLSGQMNRAREEAQQLHKLAPGSRLFDRIASDPVRVMDSNSERVNGFVSQGEFYTQYRRSGIDINREARQQQFPGSATAVLLFDRVLEIHGDGSASLYLHRVRRLLNKEGISNYGEVALPRGADLLELRTIKSNGEVIEPELSQQKPTVSMPALEPGDSIEEEYVTHYPEWRHLPLEASRFEFGSATAPLLHSRLVVLTPKVADITFELRNGAPQPRVEVKQSEIVRTWELDDMGVLAGEPFSPTGDLLPAVTVTANESTLDQLRDRLIDATRIGPHVIEAALGQKLTGVTGEREKARALYRFVTSRIESTGPDLETGPAEDALASGEGSRTAALLALARETGLKAGLLMARGIDQVCSAKQPLTCYNQPLVRFWADGELIDADAEADDLAFGAVSAGLDPRSALLVTLKSANAPELVSVSIKPAQERSTAEGDLFLDSTGNLSASVHVRLGAARSQQIRANLRSSSEREKQGYFEQFAERIFPGVVDVKGEAINAADPEQPLDLKLRCRVPQFLRMQPGEREMNQLAPALGLRIFAGKSAKRHLPLFLGSVLFESTVFHLHLPRGVRVSGLPEDFVSSSEFGSYQVRFTQTEGQLDVSREFAIPIQVIQPEQFPVFLKFAAGIESAEQQHIRLVVENATTDRQTEVAQQSR